MRKVSVPDVNYIFKILMKCGALVDSKWYAEQIKTCADEISRPAVAQPVNAREKKFNSDQSKENCVHFKSNLKFHLF